MIIVCFLILLLILYFIYLLMKFSGTEKNEYNVKYFRDNEYIKYPAIIVGYLQCKKVKTEHFIATALDFVRKGFIKIEKIENGQDYIFTIIKSIKASYIEKLALKVFFNTDDLEIGEYQTIERFKEIIKVEKRFGNYEKLKKQFNTEIRDYFDKKQDIKKITNDINIFNNLLCYFLFLIMCFSLLSQYGKINLFLFFCGTTIVYLFFLITIRIVKLYLLGYVSKYVTIIAIATFINIFWLLVYGMWVILVALIVMASIIIFDDMLQRRKTNLANACAVIKGLKRYISDYSNIKEYDIDNVYLWDYYYVYAVALGIKKV